MENLVMILFPVVVVAAYFFGLKKGLNAPFSFFTQMPGSDATVEFNSENTREETIDKIKKILIEKELLLQKAEEVNARTAYLAFWLCDNLENVGRELSFKKEPLSAQENSTIKEQFDNARYVLQCGRWLFNPEIIKDDAKYLALISFVGDGIHNPGILNKNVTGEPEKDFQNKVTELFNFCRTGSVGLNIQTPSVLAN